MADVGGGWWWGGVRLRWLRQKLPRVAPFSLVHHSTTLTIDNRQVGNYQRCKPPCCNTDTSDKPAQNRLPKGLNGCHQGCHPVHTAPYCTIVRTAPYFTEASVRTGERTEGTEGSSSTCCDHDTSPPNNETHDNRTLCRNLLGKYNWRLQGGSIRVNSAVQPHTSLPCPFLLDG